MLFVVQVEWGILIQIICSHSALEFDFHPTFSSFLIPFLALRGGLQQGFCIFYGHVRLYMYSFPFQGI